MALTVQSLIDAAALALLDAKHVRWKRSELLAYFNAGQRRLGELRPDQLVHPRDLVLTAGWRQELPADVQTLIDITNNVNTTSRRITKTDLWTLDAVAGGWRAMQPAREVLHFMYDLKAPREFLVYPPAAAGIKVRALASSMPSDLSAETEAPTVPERWMDALLDFVLFRAYSKDAEYGGNAARAAAHLQLFHTALDVQVKTASEMAAPKN